MFHRSRRAGNYLRERKKEGKHVEMRTPIKRIPSQATLTQLGRDLKLFYLASAYPYQNKIVF